MNESLSNLLSQLQTISKELRSIRTAWEAPRIQTPTPPAVAIKPPSSTVAAPPSLLTASVTPPQIATEPSSETKLSPEPFTPPPKPATPLATPPQILTTPSTAIAVTTKIIMKTTIPVMTTRNSSRSILPNKALEERTSANNVHTKKELATMSKVPGGMRRLDWRPPWRYVETTLRRFTMTSPNALGRTEWRPPWFPPSCNRNFALRTSRIRVGWNDVCHKTHEVHHAFT
ncbi:hypothetical protein HanIR_Chr15g0740021 [Helianthus annuus]|nr:hypothetical protein HanIR_Chr15g0740021 [Helianthus annuus]